MSIDLTPEFEAMLRAEANARGMELNALIAEAVAAYLGLSPSSQASIRAAEMAWLEHPDHRYLGRWVVLEGDRVVVSGADPKSLYEHARAAGIQSPFLIYVSPEESEPFAGGWID